MSTWAVSKVVEFALTSTVNSLPLSKDFEEGDTYILLPAAFACVLSIPKGVTATMAIAIIALKNFLEFSAFFVIFCSIFLF